jgi:hypothetical protein
MKLSKVITAIISYFLVFQVFDMPGAKLRFGMQQGNRHPSGNPG